MAVLIILEQHCGQVQHGVHHAYVLALEVGGAVPANIIMRSISVADRRCRRWTIPMRRLRCCCCWWWSQEQSGDGTHNPPTTAIDDDP